MSMVASDIATIPTTGFTWYVVVRQIMAVQWNEELGEKSDTGRPLRFLP